MVILKVDDCQALILSKFVIYLSIDLVGKCENLIIWLNNAKYW